MFETKRLIIRKLKKTDLKAMFHYAKNPNIGPRAGWRPHQNIEETSLILDWMIKEDEVFGITLKPMDTLIGTVGLHARHSMHHLLSIRELGFVLDEPYWGQGLMVEASRALIDFGLNKMGLKKITCRHYKDNQQSKRVIEKLAFTYTHIEYRENDDGSTREVMMYELLKGDNNGNEISI
jgi:[ribosomal protein S5]-alanine N-acetyltransferase